MPLINHLRVPAVDRRHPADRLLPADPRPERSQLPQRHRSSPGGLHPQLVADHGRAVPRLGARLRRSASARRRAAAPARPPPARVSVPALSRPGPAGPGRCCRPPAPRDRCRDDRRRPGDPGHDAGRARHAAAAVPVQLVAAVALAGAGRRRGHRRVRLAGAAGDRRVRSPAGVRRESPTRRRWRSVSPSTPHAGDRADGATSLTSAVMARSRPAASTCPRSRCCATASALYIRHFAQLLPYLPTHTKGNPPGPVIAMHLLGITTAGRLTAACVLAGSLCAPLTYALGRTLGSEHRGRVAAALAVFSPSLVLFGVTSVDYVFAALATAIAWLLVSPGPTRPGRRLRAGRARLVLLLAAAGDPGLGGAGRGPAPRLAAPRWSLAVAARRRPCWPSRSCWPRSPAMTRWRSCARSIARVPRRRGRAPAVRVLAVRLAGGVAGDARLADRLARAALAGRRATRPRSRWRR